MIYSRHVFETSIFFLNEWLHQAYGIIFRMTAHNKQEIMIGTQALR